MVKKGQFDALAKYYDFFTKILMMGTYGRVRRKIVSSMDRDGIALDLCCGTGYVTGHIHANKVVGLDLSTGMLGVNRDKNLGRSDILLINGDAYKLPFKDDSFSSVYCTLSTHEFMNFVPILEESHRVLKEDGSLVLYDMCKPSNPLLKPFTIFVKYVVEMGKFYIYTTGEWKEKLEKLAFRDITMEVLYHASILVKARK